jgi:FtsP/CotA-like multicopper oxidase with cupredoxin domain
MTRVGHLLVALVGVSTTVSAQQQPTVAVRRPPPIGVETVAPNDNRQPGGTMRRDTLVLRLEARNAAWRPDLNVDSTVTVQAFAEEGGAPRIPGPLLRVETGREVEVTLRNSLDSALVVHGLRGGPSTDDTLQLPPRSARVVRFRAGAPGTYLYWGSTTKAAIAERTWRDSQLTGALVIDATGTRPDPAERIFVMTVIDLVPDNTVRNPAKEDIWELAINGRSWPHSERLRYAVGENVRWRWLNGTYLPHPMHLHGFHFRVLAKGEGNRDSTYAPTSRRLAATELMMPGGTFRMDWVPTRAGSWLFHCHMIPHVTPFPDRPDSVKSHHGAHDVPQHAMSAMAGLVLGITTVDRPRNRPTTMTKPTRHLRVLAQQAAADSGKSSRRGYVVQDGAPPKRDSVNVPGSPLILTRGQTTAITVVNHMREATTVHWHGMEIESVYDGVPGWGRTGTNMAPLLTPGDSFTVTMTPPRAGTFIYHTHMDEGAQLGTGMYGAMLVMEPGERHDPATDLTFVLGSAVVRDSLKTTLNGRTDPMPMTLRSGTRYRLRFINILAAEGAQASLLMDSIPLRWRARAKDGADLPAGARVESAATLKRLGTGETYDFEWTPTRPMQAVLQFRLGSLVLRQPIHVR